MREAAGYDPLRGFYCLYAPKLVRLLADAVIEAIRSFITKAFRKASGDESS